MGQQGVKVCRVLKICLKLCKAIFLCQSQSCFNHIPSKPPHMIVTDLSFPNNISELTQYLLAVSFDIHNSIEIFGLPKCTSYMPNAHSAIQVRVLHTSRQLDSYLTINGISERFLPIIYLLLSFLL